MVDVSRLSQNVRTKIEDIGKQDGKKGITSQTERNQLAQALANGEITGYGAEYAQEQINKFDFEEAKKSASDFVKKTIDKAMKIAGDKHQIDDATELAVLDQIINDPNSSPEDIAYAKAVRQNSQYAVHQDVVNENAQLRTENEGLRVENQELKTELESTKEELKVTQEELETANKTIEELKTDIDTLEGKNKALAEELTSSMSEIAKLKQEKANLGRKLAEAENKFKKGEISESKLKEIVEGAKKAAENITNEMKKHEEDCKKKLDELKNRPNQKSDPFSHGFIRKADDFLKTIGAGTAKGGEAIKSAFGLQ